MDTNTNTDTNATSNTGSKESISELNANRLLVRTRAALDEWFVLVVVALLALSAFGGWGTYSAFAADSGADEGETTEPWSTTGGFDHYAIVQEQNEVFEVGTELTDRSTYFTAIAPELEGEFRYAYEATSGDAEIDVELERVVRSTDDGTVYWSTNESLETVTAEGLEPGEERTASFSVDVPATENETERIEESLEASPGTVEITVVAEVTLTGTIDDDPIERTDVYELEIDPGRDVYHVDGPEADRRSASGGGTAETATASSSAPLGPVSSIVVLIASLGALGAVLVAKKRDTLTPSPEERERLRLESEREEFDDWISRGSIPNDLHDRSRIAVETLEDLVDVAIDCDRRVIQDGRIYYVVDGELMYIYESAPWSESGAAAFDGSDGSDGADPAETADGKPAVSTPDDEHST